MTELSKQKFCERTVLSLVFSKLQKFSEPSSKISEKAENMLL
jgi:hypothetical protein